MGTEEQNEMLKKFVSFKFWYIIEKYFFIKRSNIYCRFSRLICNIYYKFPDRLTITRNRTYTYFDTFPIILTDFFFYINDKHFNFLFTICKIYCICNHYDRIKILIILFWHFRNLRWNIWYPHVYCQWRHRVCWRLMGSGGMEESHRSSVGQ